MIGLCVLQMRMRSTCWWTGSHSSTRNTFWCAEKLSWSTRQCHAIMFTHASGLLLCVLKAANVWNLQGQAAESGREAGRRGVRAEVSSQQTWCVLFSEHKNEKSKYTNKSISDSFSEKDWTEEDKGREQELMAELVTIIEQRNQIVNNMDQDRQR